MISHHDPDGVCAKEIRVTRLIKCTSCQLEHSLSRGLFRGGEVVTIQLQKQNANHKSCALIAINKCVVADDGSRVSRRHIDGVRGVRIGVKLLRPRQGRLQQGLFTQARRATVKC